MIATVKAAQVRICLVCDELINVGDEVHPDPANRGWSHTSCPSPVLNRYVVLELTHRQVETNVVLWALWLRYLPNILGEVIAHDSYTSSSWDWSASPLRAAA